MGTLVAVAAVGWTRVLRYPWSRLRRALFERGVAGMELPPVASVEDVRACLAQVTWTPDGPTHLWDAVRRPESVWRDKRDDCDGFAVLAAALLERALPGCEPLLLTVVVRPLRRAHTVCIFRGEDGRLRMFDNARLRDEAFATYAEAAELLTARGHTPICWDIADPRRLNIREFHRFGGR